jgi:hypothetical protein
MKEFRATADIEVLLLFDFAKLKSSSSEDVSVQGTNLGIVGEGAPEAQLRMREIHLGNSVMQALLVVLDCGEPSQI